MLKYWILFGLQSVGAFIMLCKGVPLYRNFLSGSVDPGNRHALWALLVLGLIQPGFWWIRRHALAVGNKSSGKTVLGLGVMFLGRMIFVFVGGLFSAVFYMGVTEVHLTRGIFFLVALLFSMFCYTLELERLGKALIGQAPSLAN